MISFTRIWDIIKYIYASLLAMLFLPLYDGTKDSTKAKAKSIQTTNDLFFLSVYTNHLSTDASPVLENKEIGKKSDGLLKKEENDATDVEEGRSSSWEDNDEDEDFEYDMNDALIPVTCTETTKTEMNSKKFYGFDKFSIVPDLPPTHKFIPDEFLPVAASEFLKAYHRDVKILQQGLPNGIFVKGYEQRMDLFSVLITGPENTPYESGLFAFDIKLPSKYPHRPPKFHFISYTRTRLNPNLYTNGKVCVSLLGTWPSHQACDSWSSSESTLLQVLISIQGLILVREPYFNEPGATTSEQNETNLSLNAFNAKSSKSYNETVLLKLLQCTGAMLNNPPLPWTLETTAILKVELPKLIARVEGWTKMSNIKPAFPLPSMLNHHEVPQLIHELRQAYKKYYSNPLFM